MTAAVPTASLVSKSHTFLTSAVGTMDQRMASDPACHRLHSLVPAAEARTDVADVLNVTYLSRTLKVHSSDMVGEFSAQAHAETGAAAQGFVLADHVQPKGQINQPTTPQNQTRPPLAKSARR